MVSGTFGGEKCEKGIGHSPESMHLDDDQVSIDTNAWVPFVSFLFVGFVTASQMRVFFLHLCRLSRLSISLVDSDLMVLVLSFIMGIYFTSWVTLMRTNLPPRYRQGITHALGDLDYDYYRRQFHATFFLSSSVTIIFLIVTTIIGRSRAYLSNRHDDNRFYQDYDGVVDDCKRADDMV